jgi:hypothetical protein
MKNVAEKFRDKKTFEHWRGCFPTHHNYCVFFHHLFGFISNRPWALAKIISLRGNHVEVLGLWFIWKAYMYRYITTKKSSQAKNLPNTEKMGDQWLSSIKLYYSKKWEVFYSPNSLWVIAVLNVSQKRIFDSV